jgi:macrodomain Ter protein organizer (MatP/YcbG family)
MARKKWELPESDASEARLYILRNIDDMFEHRDIEEKFAAKEAFRGVKSGDYEGLKGWIARHLDDLQIKRLRTALRVAKTRRKKYTRNITLDEDSHMRLAGFAKRYNVTLSEAIDRLIEIADRQDRQASLF